LENLDWTITQFCFSKKTTYLANKAWEKRNKGKLVERKMKKKEKKRKEKKRSKKKKIFLLLLLRIP
jgi:hypothetical protein